MSTTKKVAKESVSTKPVRATVKRPKKTIDQADLAPLSLRKKSVVSVEKPQVQKKALPAAKAATKPQSKTKKTTESPIFEVKKPSLSELSAQKMTRSTSKPAVVVETEQQERIQLIQALGANLVEQALSLKTEQVMTNVSRTAGLVLASVGIMFALFSLPTVIGQTSQLAAIGEFDVATSALPISINCDDPLLYTSIPCADEVDQKPDAAFVIGSAPDVLKERVPVTVTVEHAQSVRLFAYNKTAGTHHPLGLMTRVTESTWSLDWDTAKYNDDDYKVRVLVGNFYGTYEEVHSGTVTVLNHPLTEQAPVESLDDTVSTDDSESVASLTPITISSPTKESLGEFEFIVKVSNADKVKLYATHLETSQSSLIGYAIAVDDTTWRIRWVSGTSPLGVYRVRAQVIEDGESTVGGDILVKKVAALTDSSYQEITLTPETDLEAVNETGSASRRKAFNFSPTTTSW